MFKYWIFVFALAAVKGNPVVSQTSNDENVGFFKTCTFSEGLLGFANCAAERSLKMMRQINQEASVEILPGVALISENPSHERTGKSIEDAKLPSDPKDKIEKLMDLIFEAAGEFFEGRTLQLKYSDIPTNGVARAFEEGRKKMKKRGKMSPLIILLALKAILVKGIALIGLKFLAIKAAIIAKIALVLALFLGSQTLFSGLFSGNSKQNNPFFGGFPGIGGIGGIGQGGWGGSGGGHPAYGPPGWSTNSIGGNSGWNSQLPYARSIEEMKEDELNSNNAQYLAYSEQKP